MALLIENHTVKGNRVSQHISSKNKVPMLLCQGIILHYTAGSSLSSDLTQLSSPHTKVSAHILVGRDSSIVQIVPFNTKAWHAGISQYMGLTDLNNCTIGIEMQNYGQLTRQKDSYFTWFGKSVAPSAVFTHHHNERTTYWHAYTTGQIKTVYQLCLLLKEHYPIEFIAGHSDITFRKQDPGPAFPLDYFKSLCI